MNTKRMISSTFVVLFFACLTPGKASAQTLYFVNTTSDTVVVGACENSLTGCSLRGAMGAANAGNGDGIEVFIPASDPGCVSGICTIALTSALPTITTSMSITGPGADRLIVQSNDQIYGSVFHNTTGLTVTIAGITIRNGIHVEGGGIFNEGSGTVNLINCAVRNNNAILGGGIGNRGHLNLINSTVSYNRTDPAYDMGGGVFSSGTMNIVNSTISHNRASDGAGIYIPWEAGAGVWNITNSTISHNSSFGYGGGIAISSPDTTVVNIKSSIIAMNSGFVIAPDVWGRALSAGFNLVGRIEGWSGSIEPTDRFGTTAFPVDPMLDPAGLQNNGGPTMTIRLLSGSPAIDKGTSNGLTGNLTTDQRGNGFMRTFDDPAVPNALGGDGTDIGAYELLPEPGASSMLAAGAVLLMLLKRRRQAIRNGLGPPSAVR